VAAIHLKGKRGLIVNLSRAIADFHPCDGFFLNGGVGLPVMLTLHVQEKLETSSVDSQRADAAFDVFKLGGGGRAALRRFSLMSIVSSRR
jgi:hypothetical protein